MCRQSQGSIGGLYCLVPQLGLHSSSCLSLLSINVHQAAFLNVIREVCNWVYWDPKGVWVVKLYLMFVWCCYTHCTSHELLGSSGLFFHIQVSIQGLYNAYFWRKQTSNLWNLLFMCLYMLMLVCHSLDFNKFAVHFNDLVKTTLISVTMLYFLVGIIITQQLSLTNLWLHLKQINIVIHGPICC